MSAFSILNCHFFYTFQLICYNALFFSSSFVSVLVFCSIFNALAFLYSVVGLKQWCGVSRTKEDLSLKSKTMQRKMWNVCSQETGKKNIRKNKNANLEKSSGCIGNIVFKANAFWNILLLKRIHNMFWREQANNASIIKL